MSTKANVAPTLPDFPGASPKIDFYTDSRTVLVIRVPGLPGPGKIVQVFVEGSVEMVGSEAVFVANAPVDLTIDYAKLKTLYDAATKADASVAVYYKLDGIRSDTTVIGLTNSFASVALPEPRVMRETNNQVTAAVPDLVVRVTTAAKLQVGDIVTFYFAYAAAGQPEPFPPVTATFNPPAGSTDQFLEVTVANGLANNVGRSLKISYEIKRGTTTSQRSAINAVKVVAGAASGIVFAGGDHTLDPYPFAIALAGPNHPTLKVDEPVPPKNPDPTALYTNPISGGAPPYTFSIASMEADGHPVAILADPAKGTVLAAGNGMARVTATDTKGASASYVLTVTGVFVLKNITKMMGASYSSNGQTTFKNARDFFKPGWRLPKLGDYEYLWRSYLSGQDNTTDIAEELGWMGGRIGSDPCYYWTIDEDPGARFLCWWLAWWWIAHPSPVPQPAPVPPPPPPPPVPVDKAWVFDMNGDLVPNAVGATDVEYQRAYLPLTEVHYVAHVFDPPNAGKRYQP